MTVSICLRDQEVRDFMNTNRDLLSQTYPLDTDIQLSFYLTKITAKRLKNASK